MFLVFLLLVRLEKKGLLLYPLIFLIISLWQTNIINRVRRYDKLISMYVYILKLIQNYYWHSLLRLMCRVPLGPERSSLFTTTSPFQHLIELYLY